MHACGHHLHHRGRHGGGQGSILTILSEKESMSQKEKMQTEELARIMDDAKPLGKSDRILLTCNRENPAALGLYQSFGFCPTGNEDEDEIELGYTLASK